MSVQTTGAAPISATPRSAISGITLPHVVNFRAIQVTTVITDLVAIGVTTVIAVLGRSWLPVFRTTADVTPSLNSVAAWLVAGWIAALTVAGVYQRKKLGACSAEYQSVLSATVVAAGLAGVGLYLAKYDLSRGFFVLEFTIGAVTLLSGRYLLRHAVHRARTRGFLQRRVLLTGDLRHTDALASVIARENWLGYRVIGVLTPPDQRLTSTPGGIPVVGHTDAIGTLVKESRVEAVICAEGTFGDAGDFRRLAWDLENHNTQVIVVPTMTDVSAERLQVRPLAGLPLVYVEQPQSEAASRWAKRAFDILGSLALILLSAPIMAAVALAIKLDDGGPVLFRQVRVGRKGSRFACLKFRSMVPDAEQLRARLESDNDPDRGPMFKLERDPRITRVGHLLRRFSLDEFPQFFNVLRGEMSLVGPRPALPAEVDRYEDHVRRRLDVRPGITGLWQVSGRSDLPWRETVRLDLYYVDNWSFMQDITILLKTARAVLKSDGAY